mgnify:CR=1 FL=1|tara:strand:- start:8726 stop:9589 length:864 start_codon:yes stop_codon:yes gene_type:complete
MSRNENRGGIPETEGIDDAPMAPASSAAAASAFSWSIPTEFVKLPSRGDFYPQGHTLQGIDRIEIKYMTAKEEDILTSRSLLKEGVALDRMLQNLVVDKTIDLSEMLVGDKNALLVAARATGYGESYQTKVTCPSCHETDVFEFDISDPNFTEFEKAINHHEVRQTENNTFVIVLPMTKVAVECKLLTGRDELRILKESERKAKKKIESSPTTDWFRSMAVSINGDTDPLSLMAFAGEMPARDARHLRIVYSEVVPNIDLSQTYDCPKCTYSADMEVPLNVDFFWPG